MKAEEIIEVLNDFGARFRRQVAEKGWRRLYIEISSPVIFHRRKTEEYKSTSYVMRCYDQNVVSLVLKLVNTDYEHLVLEAIERFVEEKK